MQTEAQTDVNEVIENEGTNMPVEKPKSKTKGKPKAKPVQVKTQDNKIADEKAREKTHNDKWNQIVEAIESGDKIAINTPQGDIILCKMTPGKAWALDENGDSIVKGIKLHRSYLKPYINSARKI